MNTFLNKVEAEREVLRLVNSSTCGVRQLTGLSSVAIDNWCVKNSVLPSEKMSKLLYALSSKCQTLSDRSNENFSPISAENSQAVINGLDDLRCELKVFSR